MSYLESLKNGNDITCLKRATWGPETEKGPPVELGIEARLEYKEGKGYCFSCMGSFKIKKSDKLGLKPAESGGQCLDSAVECLADCGLRCRMLEELVPIWKRWHLNDMRAGTVRQEEFLRQYEKDHPDWKWTYDSACEVLEKAGLYNDDQYLVGENGKINSVPYQYGHAWLYHEIPMETLERICEILDDVMEIERKGDGNGRS